MAGSAHDFPQIDGNTLGRTVVLASASPYRKQLLTDAGVEFSVLASGVDESLQPAGEPEQYAKELGLRKAQAVASRCRDALVIGADTICAIGDDVIGKPADEDEAEQMLIRACDAKLQRVITGVAVIDSRDMTTRSTAVSSLVEMRDVPKELIRAYVKTGEPIGKCGALCIESGQSFVKRWEGSYSNIMGLPLEWLLPSLLELAER